jgi:tripartite motif-containing protein 9/67
MIRLVEMKKKELINFIHNEKASRIKGIKDQVSHLSLKIQKTTGTLQYCVETLKEPDPTSFLQTSEYMLQRMSNILNKFPKDAELQPKVDFDFDFVLNSDAAFREINKLNYKQIKVPNTPAFIADECTTNPNEIIILSWQQKTINRNNVQGYILEIDEGSDCSPFKEVYRGSDTMCQINGLIPNSTYNARVKAYNQAGYSSYSNIISISASPSNYFHLFIINELVEFIYFLLK